MLISDTLGPIAEMGNNRPETVTGFVHCCIFSVAFLLPLDYFLKRCSQSLPLEPYDSQSIPWMSCL